jgi:hypothetical protein
MWWRPLDSDPSRFIVHIGLFVSGTIHYTPLSDYLCSFSIIHLTSSVNRNKQNSKNAILRHHNCLQWELLQSVVIKLIKKIIHKRTVKRELALTAFRERYISSATTRSKSRLEQTSDTFLLLILNELSRISDACRTSFIIRSSTINFIFKFNVSKRPNHRFNLSYPATAATYLSTNINSVYKGQ